MLLKNPALLLIAIASLLIQNLAVSSWILDDSFISFRYAENLVAGHGLVFNPGERVEGYTCFLWVMMLAGGRWLGIDTPFFSRILGFLFSLATLAAVYRASSFFPGTTDRAGAIAGLFLGTCGIFSVWAVSGMETSLFTFLLFLSVAYYASIRESTRASSFAILGVLLALLVMSRPEGLLPAGIVFADIVLRTVRQKARAGLAGLIVFLLIFLPYFFWRYSYYGYLLPNTFYAKVGTGSEQVARGMKYALRFGIAALWLLPAIFHGFFRDGLRIPALVFGSYLLYVIAVGGDIMPAFRFFAPVIPILCLATALWIASPQRSATAMLLMTAVVVGYNLVQFRFHPQMLSYILSDTVAEDGKEAGLLLSKIAPPGAVIATNTGGSIPYYSGLRSIDMLGLNDTHIGHRKIPWLGKGPAGHEKGDGAYVLSRKPDFIHFGSSLGSAKPLFLSDREMFQIKEFHEQYVLRSYLLPSGRELLLYERRTPLQLPPSKGGRG